MHQLTSQFIASLCIICAEVQHEEANSAAEKEEQRPRTAILPPPQALHARLPEIKLLCSFHLAASCPLDSQTLLLAREPGERPAESTPTGQPRTQHRGRTRAAQGSRGPAPEGQRPGPQHARARVIPGRPRLLGGREAAGAGLGAGRWGRGGDTAPPSSPHCLSLPSRGADVHRRPPEVSSVGQGWG